MTRAGRNRIRLLAVGLCLALPACGVKAPSSGPPGGATGGKAEKARRDAEELAAACAGGAGDAQARAAPELAVARSWKEWALRRAVPPKGGTPPALPAPPAPPPPVVVKAPAPRPAPERAVRERVVSAIPYKTEAEAEADALAVACEVVERKLAELDPPVRHKVSPNEVRTEFLRKDSRTARPAGADEEKALRDDGLTGPFVYVEYDVEVTADQVRELRTQDRVGAGLRVLGMLTAVALAGLLFLRADEWTRGYLTSWLALGAVALALGAAAALIFV